MTEPEPMHPLDDMLLAALVGVLTLLVFAVLAFVRRAGAVDWRAVERVLMQ